MAGKQITVGKIYQINVKPETPGERGLPKRPVERAIVSYQGINSDFNRYRSEKLKGRLEKALLIMPLEMIKQLNQEGWPISPGDLGENLTTAGIHYEDISSGQEYSVGEIEIKITEPCDSCGNLRMLPYVGRERWPDFNKLLQGRRGWYARVLKEGRISTGDLISRLG